MVNHQWMCNLKILYIEALIPGVLEKDGYDFKTIDSLAQEGFSGSDNFYGFKY